MHLGERGSERERPNIYVYMIHLCMSEKQRAREQRRLYLMCGFGKKYTKKRTTKESERDSQKA